MKPLSLSRPIPGRPPDPQTQNRYKLAYFETQYAEPLGKATGFNRLNATLHVLHQAEIAGTPADRFLANLGQMVTHRILPQQNKLLTSRYRYLQQLFVKAAEVKHQKPFSWVSDPQGRLTPQGKTLLQQDCACDACDTPEKAKTLLTPSLSQLIKGR